MLDGMQEIFENLSISHMRSTQLHAKHSKLIADFLTKNGLRFIREILSIYEKDDILENYVKKMCLYDMTVRGPLIIFPEACKQLQEQCKSPPENLEKKLIEECLKILEEMNTTFEKLPEYHENLERLNQYLQSKTKSPVKEHDADENNCEEGSWEMLIFELGAPNKGPKSNLSSEEEKDPFENFSEDEQNPSFLPQFNLWPCQPNSSSASSIPPETENLSTLYRL